MFGSQGPEDGRAGNGLVRSFHSGSSDYACRSVRRWVALRRTELLVVVSDVEVLGTCLFALLLTSHAASSRLFVRASRSELWQGHCDGIGVVAL